MSTHAVKFAALSIPVFPCQLNKKPYTGCGFKDASTDPEMSAFRALNIVAQKIGLSARETHNSKRGGVKMTIGKGQP
jgi:hypothetical protein